MNTSGGTLPNTTGNLTLITLQRANNLAGKTLNLQDLTFNRQRHQCLAACQQRHRQFRRLFGMYNVGSAAWRKARSTSPPTAIYRFGGNRG